MIIGNLNTVGKVYGNFFVNGNTYCTGNIIAAGTLYIENINVINTKLINTFINYGR